MSKVKKFSATQFISDIVSAVDKYGEEHVDIIMDVGRDVMYLSYHSLNDSYNLSKDYPLMSSKAIKTANDFNIGWSEI